MTLEDAIKAHANSLPSGFLKAYYNDPVVHQMCRAGLPLEEIVAALSEQKAKLKNRVVELESIAPKKIKLPNGETVIWRCPDELIPNPPSTNP